jgi:hypothetical protein
MTNQPKPKADEARKPAYEPPQIVRLNEIDAAQGGIPVGSCINGGSAVAGDCETGGSATGPICTAGGGL